jgi:glycerate kinase
MLIAHAIRKGARKIILGLGGSATNDGGMGIAYGLGFQCTDGKNHLLKPSGENLIRIRKIIPPKKIPEVQFTICCDVENPLFGRKGAAYVFSPQKGAGPADVLLLDKGLRNLSKQIAVHRRIYISGIKGMGAAGGAMAFLYSYFNCTVERGADIVIRASKIARAISRADLLITGEGTIDDQSIRGKVISRLIPLASQKKVPVMFVCGQMKRSANTQKIWGDIPVLELLRAAGSKKRAMQEAVPLLKRAIAKKFKFHFNAYVV